MMTARVGGLVTLALLGCDDHRRAVEAERPPCRVTVSDAVTGERLYEVINHRNDRNELVRVERPERVITFERAEDLTVRRIDEGRDGVIDEIWRTQTTSVLGDEGQPLVREAATLERIEGGRARLIYSTFCERPPEDLDGPYGFRPILCETDGRVRYREGPLLEAADGQVDHRVLKKMEGDRRIHEEAWRDPETGHLGVRRVVTWNDVEGQQHQRHSLDGRWASGGVMDPAGHILEAADGQTDQVMESIWTPSLADPTAVERKRFDLDGDGRFELVQRWRGIEAPDRYEGELVDVSGPEPMVISRWWYEMAEGQGVTGFGLDGRPGSRPDGRPEVTGRCAPPEYEGGPSRLTWLDVDGDGEPELTAEHTEGVRWVDGRVRTPGWVVRLSGQVGPAIWPSSWHIHNSISCSVSASAIPDFEAIYPADGEADFRTVWTTERLTGLEYTWVHNASWDARGVGQVDTRCQADGVADQTTSMGSPPTSDSVWCDQDLDGDGRFDVRRETEVIFVDAQLRQVHSWRREVTDLHTSETITLNTARVDQDEGERWQIEVSDPGDVIIPDDIVLTTWSVMLPWMGHPWTPSFWSTLEIPYEPSPARARRATVAWDSACLNRPL